MAVIETERLELTVQEASLPQGILLAVKKVKEFVGERGAVQVDMVFPSGGYAADSALTWYTSRRGVVPINAFSQLSRGEGLMVFPSYDSKKPEVIHLDIRQAA
jgi:hypothetical protein